MTILYSDSLYPGKTDYYKGKTIGQILRDHINPHAFIRQFNARNGRYAIADEAINQRTRDKFPQ